MFKLTTDWSTSSSARGGEATSGACFWTKCQRSVSHAIAPLHGSNVGALSLDRKRVVVRQLRHLTPNRQGWLTHLEVKPAGELVSRIHRCSDS